MADIISQIQQTSLVEWLGTVTGLIGVYLSVKERVLAWPFYVLCYALYAYLSFSASLFAAMVLNACFIPISLWGWWQWQLATKKSDRDREVEEALEISHVRFKTCIILVCICILGTIGIGGTLSRYTTGAMPYLDAFATTLSFVAQWMLGRKLVENWVAWIVADCTFLVLWGIQGYWVAVAMFLVFTGLAVMGLVSWKKEARTRES